MGLRKMNSAAGLPKELTCLSDWWISNEQLNACVEYIPSNSLLPMESQLHVAISPPNYKDNGRDAMQQ